MQITKERLAQLEDAEAKLRALENGGVDNWQWYDQALEGYQKAKEQKEAIDYAFDCLIERLCSNICEPAGSGAGYGILDQEELQDAKAEFINVVKEQLKD